MKSYEAIQSMLDAASINRATIARRLGASRGTVGNQLNGRNELSMSKCREYLDQLGYEIAFVPKDSRLPKGSYRID